MSYPYSLIKTAITGDILAASDYNNEHTNHITNNIPDSIGGASANAAAMQTTVSPGGIGTESLATTLLGEIQRIRYAINRILGKGTQWYDTPDIDLHTANSGLPAGTMADFGGTATPSGWLLCDGSAVSRSSYVALFTAIGTTWGVGDGATTFNVPNMQRKASVGSGGSGSATLANTVGSTGGTETGTTTGHTHTGNTHTHTISHTHQTTTGHNGSGTVYVDATSPFGTTNVNHLFYSWAGGGSGPSSLAYDITSNASTANTGNQSDTGMTTVTDTVSTIQPSAVVLKIIKT